MLAVNYVEEKLRFPVLLQPKIDGVRGLTLRGQLTGRSLKTHANLHVTKHFSQLVYSGLDGEMAAAQETHPELCRLTSSALSTVKNEPFILWHVFDLINDRTFNQPYEYRYHALAQHLFRILQNDPVSHNYLRIVPSYICRNLEEVLYYDALWLAAGYEGSIIRGPQCLYKQGRSTVNEGGLLRIKRFIQEEAIVLRVEEGQINDNEATVNELGQTSRSTHKENMTPNGMVGRLICEDVKTKKIITVAPGRMTHDERRAWFAKPSLIVGQMIKYKHFLVGVKDKPRFPTFQCIRMASDIS
jgi:hypothetical protein